MDANNTDISPGFLSQEDLKNQEIRLMGKIIASFPYPTVIVNADNMIILSNPLMQGLFGYTIDELYGMPIENLFADRYQPKCKNLHAQNTEKNIENFIKMNGLSKDGKEFPLSLSSNRINLDNDNSLICCILQDLTHENVEREKVKKIQNYDPITNLPNRARFEKVLMKRIALAAKENHHFALILINMNKLKYINDYYGHNIGDMVLKKAGSRLIAHIRASDFLARLGSDEFVIIMDIDAPHQPGLVAKRLISAFDAPLEVSGKSIRLTISLGISIYPEGGQNETILVKNADLALARAKTLKSEQFASFSPELNKQLASKWFIEHNLALAVKKGEFALVYQPQVDLESQRISGLEALLRWNNAALGNIPPDVFIPIAESEGLIGSLGLWVFEHVCIQIQQWKKTKMPVKRVSLNLSINQLSDPELGTIFLNLCKQYDVSPQEIDLEITETSIMNLETEAFKLLDDLTQSGFSLSIDDFGSGYSSFSRLSKIPVKTLKIDKSLIQDNSIHAEKILLAIINLANNMDLTVIAEGVDSQEKYEFLLKAGCKTGQGYYFYKPLDVERVNQILRENKPHPHPP